MCRDNSVGIATRYGLDGTGIESRQVARFSSPVQTGPGAHPASYMIGKGSFPGVKRPGHGVDHPPHLASRLKKTRSITLLPLWVFVACSRVRFKGTICLRENVYLRILGRSRNQWPRGLRRGSAAVRWLELRVRMTPGIGKSDSSECCVMSGRGLCVGLITRPEEVIPSVMCF